MSKEGRKINILVLGGGGREHAIVHALSKSAVAGNLHCAPGNPGIAALAAVHSADPCDAEAVLGLCRDNHIGLVVVGPEAPLVSGVADILRKEGFPVFGPGTQGAMLEGSKAFSKTFMERHGIPTAPFNICRTLEECRDALRRRKPPFVIKADGLAAGKGVFLPDDAEEAEAICKELLSGEKLGEAGKTVVIEDFTRGKELTMFALTDGKSFRLLAPSRDHKRAFDGDKGPNTGGMGAYAPVQIRDNLSDQIVREVLLPTLTGLLSDGIDYRGVIYMGLMLTETLTGTRVSVVEYNVRFGDPETQVVLPLFQGDLGVAMKACAEGRLETLPDWGNKGHALCVVLASGGYPGAFRKGLPIDGLDRNLPKSDVYHAGTAQDKDGNIVTSGGRVLTVVGVGDTFTEAKQNAYERTSRIRFDDMHYRQDIGWSEA